MWWRLISRQLQRISALPTETEFNQTCTQRSLNESSLCVEGQGHTCHFRWHFSNFKQNCYSSLSIVWFLLNPAHSNHLMDLHHSWAQGEGHVSKFTRVREETLQSFKTHTNLQMLLRAWSGFAVSLEQLSAGQVLCKMDKYCTVTRCTVLPVLFSTYKIFDFSLFGFDVKSVIHTNRLCWSAWLRLLHWSSLNSE